MMMAQSAGVAEKLSSKLFWSDQIVIIQQITPHEVTLDTFSGLHGFFVLITGVLLAFAFQLLLSNFFIALGISYSETQSIVDVEDSDSSSLSNKIEKIGTIVGLRTLGTISLTLFAACFLAVKLSFLHDRLLGAILGLLVWAAYLALLIWISSITVSSVVGTLLKTATSGLQGIIGTAAIAIGAKNVSEQLVTTAETAAMTIRQELSIAVDTATVGEAIDNYLQTLELPESDRQDIRDEFERLVTDPKMKSIVRENHLRNIGRQTFVDLVNSRTDFSKQSIAQALDSWETFWQQMWGKPAQSTNNGLLSPALAIKQEDLKPSQLTPKLEQLIEATRERQAVQQAQATQKVAETAAWWLFGTIFVSAVVSAIAGYLSVTR